MRPLRRLAFAALASALAFAAVIPSATAAEEVSAKPLPIKLLKQYVWNAKAKARLARAQQLWKEYKKTKRAPSGTWARPYTPEKLAEADRPARASASLRGRSISQIEALGTNVRANDPANDLVPAGAGQSEGSIAVWNNYVVVAWNDGDGFDRAAPNDDIFGVAYSTDGGATFTDAGIPPKRTNWTWVSDPIVTVNEKTGRFYVCGLIDSTVNWNGIGVANATFSGNTLNWGTTNRTRLLNSGSNFLDKPWIAADSSSDSVYVIYVDFLATTGAQIEFQRSADGVAWPATATKLSSTAANGLVQGPRVATGPNGEVYTAWAEISTSTNFDNFRFKASTNAGATFGTERTPSNYYDNFATGSPGFNRRRGIGFPSLAVDRSPGANRGRVYVAWNESVDYYPELNLLPVGNISEPLIENHSNDTPGTAINFTVGNAVRGRFIDANDFDYFKFTATAGQTIVAFLDSVDTGAEISLRLICSNGTTFLGASSLGTGQQCIVVYTIPSNGTYYLRTADLKSTTGGYRIVTQLNAITSGERSRDHRDVFVTSSSNSGTAWSTPTRVNQDAALYDDFLPEVAVDPKNGRPYVAWYDWRDTPAANCGGFSNVYLARSDNGGASWIEVGALTDVSSDWTNELGNLIPNQGDYISLTADTVRVAAAWGDARNGNADLYTTLVPLGLTPVAVSLVAYDAAPDRVALRWFAAGYEGGGASVERRSASAALEPEAGWSLVADVAVEGSGVVNYLDLAVTPGSSYDYRLRVRDPGGDVVSPATRVEVPARPALSLAGVTPNPASDRFLVSFAMPSGEAARLNLYDVSGRLVRSRDVTSLGAGRHALQLDTRGLEAGLYIVELAQGGQRATTRVSVVR